MISNNHKISHFSWNIHDIYYSSLSSSSCSLAFLLTTQNYFWNSETEIFSWRHRAPCQRPRAVPAPQTPRQCRWWPGWSSDSWGKVFRKNNLKYRKDNIHFRQYTSRKCNVLLVHRLNIYCCFLTILFWTRNSQSH